MLLWRIVILAEIMVFLSKNVFPRRFLTIGLNDLDFCSVRGTFHKDCVQTLAGHAARPLVHSKGGGDGDAYSRVTINQFMYKCEFSRRIVLPLSNISPFLI